MAKIYGHLNYLRSNVEGGASLPINGFAPTVDDLPASAEINSIYIVNGDEYNLYAWDGEAWHKLNTNTLPFATEQVPGIVQLGTLAGASGDVPSPNKVVTEEVLAQYRTQGGAGVPSGTIIMWWGLITNIPPGWVFCDGTSGTPDLRDRFPKCIADPSSTAGEDGGSDYTTLTTNQLPIHKHSQGGTFALGTHNHPVQVSVQAGGGSHFHTTNGQGFSASGTTGYQNSNHTHGPGSITGDLASSGSGRVPLVLGGVGTIHADADSGGAYQVLYNTSGSSYGLGSNTVNIDNGQTDGQSADHAHQFSVSGTTNAGTTAYASDSHTHNASGSTTAVSAGSATLSGDTGSTGLGQVIDNRPKFKSMIFIMKL